MPSLDKLAIAAGFQSKAFLVQLGQVCSGRFPCKAFPDQARLCPSAPATNSLKPWPALWPPTLAMKSQKPCSERWPVDAAARCASNAASEQTMAFSVFLQRRSPTKSLKPRPALWIPTLAMKLQKPCPERWLTACRKPLRPTQQTLGSTAAAFKRGTFLQLLAMKLLRPVPQLWPNARLKTLQPSALAAASRAESLTQFGQRATAPVERSEALGPSRRSCNFQAAALG